MVKIRGCTGRRRNRTVLRGAAAVLVALGLVGAAGLSGSPSSGVRWTELVPGVWMTAAEPHTYALVAAGDAVVIDPSGPDALSSLDQTGARRCRYVLLTHHHRWVAAGGLAAARRGLPVFGPKKEAAFLTPEGVARYWVSNVPLRTSRVAHLVLGQGIPGVRATVADGTCWTLGPFKIEAVETPGHSFGHVCYAVRRGSAGPIVFAGGLLCGSGTVPFPYTLEWDHWTAGGIDEFVDSLKRVAILRPSLLCPTFGTPLQEDIEGAIDKTLAHAEQVGFLKSFERFSERVGNLPAYRFLAEEQVATAGQKPFTKLSDHLFVTGNTYLLVSRSGATLAVDLWGQRSVQRVQELVSRHGWRMPEVVLISHAHFDHYDGIYEMADRDQFEVWTLDRVAEVVTEPDRYRHPFTDPRPVRVDRVLRHGEELTWREYRFRVVHFPGQTEFTMGVETWIDGRHCIFTADNFFHMRQFSGSGGWTGLNRALPDGYARSAATVLRLGPDWVLAEHGGPFEFDREDFRRREAWARKAAEACDRLCRSGSRFVDWDLHGLACEPVLVRARRNEELWVELRRRRAFADDLVVRPDPSISEGLRFVGLRQGANGSVKLGLRVDDSVSGGRHVAPFRVYERGLPAAPDLFLVVDVVSASDN